MSAVFCRYFSVSNCSSLCSASTASCERSEYTGVWFVTRWRFVFTRSQNKTRMWASSQRDSRPAEYRWRPLLNAAVWLTPTTTAPCSNAAKNAKPVEICRGPQTRQQISAVSRPKFTILSGHVEEVLLFNKFFFRLSMHALVPKI